MDSSAASQTADFSLGREQGEVMDKRFAAVVATCAFLTGVPVSKLGQKLLAMTRTRHSRHVNEREEAHAHEASKIADAHTRAVAVLVRLRDLADKIGLYDNVRANVVFDGKIIQTGGTA
jgi:hypothetical protein